MGHSESATEWRCTDCGDTYTTNTRSCRVCDGQSFARFDERTIVYERYEEDDDETPRTIRHLNKDAIAYLLTDTTSLRIGVAVAVLLVAFVANSLVTDVIGGTAGMVAWTAVVGGYVVAAVSRRPSEGVTIQSLGGRVSFGGEPEPYLERFQQRADVLLRYASGWKTPLYIVDREYWFVPARLDGLRYRSAPDDWSRYIAVGGGLLAGLAAGGLASTAYDLPISIGVGGVAALVGGIALWLYLRSPTDLDTLVFRTDGGTRALFKLPAETAATAVEQYESAMAELDEPLLTVEHDDGLTEYVPRSKLLVAGRRTVTWTWLSLVVGAVIAVLAGVLTWLVTGVVGGTTVQRTVASALVAGLFVLAVWFSTRPSDEGELSSLAASRAIPSAELDRVFEAFTDTFETTVTVTGTTRTPFRRVQYRTQVAPEQVEILDYYEGRWYLLRYAKFIAAVVIATVVTTLLARAVDDGLLWLYLSAIGGLVTLGALVVLSLEDDDALIRLQLRDGLLRRYRLEPDDAAAIRQTFCDSQPTVSTTDDSLFWTQHRYANLERAGVVTPSVPSLGWARKLVVLLPLAFALGGAVYLVSGYDLGLIPPAVVAVLGVVLSVVAFGWLAPEEGTQVVTASGRLAAPNADAEAVCERLQTIRGDVLEFDAGTRDADTWYIVPQAIAALKKWRPSALPFFVAGVLSLIIGGGAAYGTFDAVGSSTVGYVSAAIVGLCVFFVVVFVLVGLLERAGIPVWDRTRADLVGTERIETTAQTGASEFEAFDSLPAQSESDPTVYRVGRPESTARPVVDRVADVFGSLGSSSAGRDGPASVDDTPAPASTAQPRTAERGVDAADDGEAPEREENAPERTHPEQRAGDAAETTADPVPSSGATDAETESREPAPSDVWYKLLVGGVLVWGATFLFPPLVVVAWPLLPVATFFDARRMYRLTGTPRFWWGYVLGTLVPVLGIVVAIAYVLRRPDTVPEADT
ncbi:uncharacterized protein NP_4690A [Natronomonas pharaonis DSM 2160]|uniref:Uncharacterized protein n=1 Tax=Natronomonas pharaonis (strain ATCC 35678 / DSM 2160 / CIP 103997 / JCM 8858 / NBRC 14720 / NCIMB 2260 / Gabara) TaxID=348780 RepID=A0A1U7EYW1_NATPD|nr:hypothetical protein [Natronomonas pharaonis]CAI50436.1 uncharacterized protein NP_4690A [Natronomonas pharaonis DSM 2160]